MKMKAAKIRLNNQTDFSFIEQFQESDDNGNPVPAPVPENSIDFEIEFFADNGVRFKVSRRNGIYDHCEKLDDNRLCVYVPLSKCFLGSGWLCQKLWISSPDAFWNNAARNICIPSCPGIWLWNGPSDDVKASAEIEAFIGTVYRGKDGVTPEITADEQGNIYSDGELLTSVVAEAATKANAAAERAENAVPVIEEIEGAAVTIDVQPNHIYKCGELTSLKIQSVADSAQIAEVIFTSGAAATELALPDTLSGVTGRQIPQPNKTYKIFFQSNTATISD